MGVACTAVVEVEEVSVVEVCEPPSPLIVVVLVVVVLGTVVDVADVAGGGSVPSVCWVDELEPEEVAYSRSIPTSRKTTAQTTSCHVFQERRSLIPNSPCEGGGGELSRSSPGGSPGRGPQLGSDTPTTCPRNAIAVKKGHVSREVARIARRRRRNL